MNKATDCPAYRRRPLWNLEHKLVVDLGVKGIHGGYIRAGKNEEDLIRLVNDRFERATDYSQLIGK
jgi:hypothetical protein